MQPISSASHGFHLRTRHTDRTLQTGMKIFKVPQHLRYSSLEELCDWLDENRELVYRSLWRVNSAAWEKWLDAREADPRLRDTETTYDEYLKWAEERDEDMCITESEEEDGPGALPMRAHMAHPIVETSNSSNEAEVLQQGRRTTERISRDSSDHRCHRKATTPTAPAASASSFAGPSRQVQHVATSTTIEANMGASNASPLRATTTHQLSSDPPAIPASHSVPPLLSTTRPVARLTSQSTLSHLDASREYFLRYVDYTAALEELVCESFQRHPELMEDEVLRRVMRKVEERMGALQGYQRESGVQTGE